MRTQVSRLAQWVLPAIMLSLILSTLACREDLTAPPSKDSESQLAAAAVAALAFYQVSAGENHACGVTTDQRVFCWGDNAHGQVGDGTMTDRLRPVAVGGARRFRQVSAGDHHSCGVTTDYRVYCWGRGNVGELGDGSSSVRLRPVAVAGGRQFRQVDVGYFHTCAVSYPDDRAYCWGYGGDGELGDGMNVNRLMPVSVAGGLRFHQVQASGRHTCGLAKDNRAFCWGENLYRQLGIGASVSYRYTPTLVAGGLRFRQVDVGAVHSCGVTTTYRAFCWGYGHNGQIGDGNTTGSGVPKAVSGGLSLERVSTGHYHTCAETTLNRAYCWGNNNLGQLGDGTITDRLKPVMVRGGHLFTQVSSGQWHSCGTTPAHVAYCWGKNGDGQLGDGTKTNRRIPTAVAGTS